jgi:hypothetical protein
VDLDINMDMSSPFVCPTASSLNEQRQSEIPIG